MAEMTLVELSLEIEDMVEDCKETAESEYDGEYEEIDAYNVDLFKRAEILGAAGDKIMVFVNIGSVLIEGYSVRLISKTFIEEQYQNSNATDRFLRRNLNQHSREELLFRTGVIDNELKEDLGDVRQARNNITHDFFESIFLDSVDDIEEFLDTVMEAFSQIRELALDKEDKVVVYPEELKYENE